MQFINIVVHSVEDMNFRVHLQFEFTKLGLEEFLQVVPHSLTTDLEQLLELEVKDSGKQYQIPGAKSLRCE